MASPAQDVWRGVGLNCVFRERERAVAAEANAPAPRNAVVEDLLDLAELAEFGEQVVRIDHDAVMAQHGDVTASMRDLATELTAIHRQAVAFVDGFPRVGLVLENVSALNWLLRMR